MRKNRIIIFVLISFFICQAMAQDDWNQDNGQVKTLLGRHNKVRGFGSLDLKVSQWNEQTNLLVGGHGGIILNDKLTFGLGGYGITTRSRFTGQDGQNLYLGGGYGGLILGYSVNAQEIFHLNFPIMFGGGGLDVLEDEINLSGGSFGNITESTGFFILEPGVELEINIARFFRFALGGSYRFIEGADLNNVDDNNLNDWSTHVSFKFGKF